MIIRLTVKDNDFTEYIEPYMKNFVSYIRELTSEFDMGENPTFEQLHSWRQRDKEVNRVMNPNMSIILTDNDKKFIIEQVKRTFNIYFSNRFEQDTVEYLMRSLDVKVLVRMEDKWENGEVFYWFQHADKYIIL